MLSNGQTKLAEIRTFNYLKVSFKKKMYFVIGIYMGLNYTNALRTTFKNKGRKYQIWVYNCLCITPISNLMSA